MAQGDEKEKTVGICSYRYAKLPSQHWPKVYKNRRPMLAGGWQMQKKQARRR